MTGGGARRHRQRVTQRIEYYTISRSVRLVGGPRAGPPGTRAARSGANPPGPGPGGLSIMQNPTPRGARHGYIEPLRQSREMQFSISETAPYRASQDFPASVCATAHPQPREGRKEPFFIAKERTFIADLLRQHRWGSPTALAALVPRIEYYKTRSGPPSWR